ncbi:hypothetical protein HID58_055803 [Brassica napus]|uniref:Uncharacterized protein n=1 Tax=Brassica napus TaxID=3708 RepID=A0ABQ8ALE9_BRANA|nr:hypothetical protein HID58_055803 [Brassica napus]
MMTDYGFVDVQKCEGQDHYVCIAWVLWTEGGHMWMLLPAKSKGVGEVDVEAAVMGDVDRRAGVEVGRQVVLSSVIQGNLLPPWRLGSETHFLF